MKYDISNAGAVTKELWQEKTVRRLSGGFSVDMSKYDASVAYAKKGAPFHVDFITRVATPIKTVAIAVAAVDADTVYKVAKGSTLKAGDTIGQGEDSATITAIDTTNPAYDAVTLDGTIGAAGIGEVLGTFVGGDALMPNILNYADVRLDGQPAITGVYEAHEVKLSNLPYPLTAAMQTALTSRFLFIP